MTGLVWCHSCERNFGWSLLDEAETVRFFFLIGLQYFVLEKKYDKHNFEFNRTCYNVFNHRDFAPGCEPHDSFNETFAETPSKERDKDAKDNKDTENDKDAKDDQDAHDDTDAIDYHDAKDDEDAKDDKNARGDKDDQDFEDSVGIEWFMRARESTGKDFAVSDNPNAAKCAAMGVCRQDKIKILKMVLDEKESEMEECLVDIVKSKTDLMDSKKQMDCVANNIEPEDKGFYRSTQVIIWCVNM